MIGWTIRECATRTRHDIAVKARWAVCLAVMLPVLLSATAAGQEAGSVRGRLTQGEPLDGALISVRGTRRRDTTDRQGRFLLTEVPAGRQVVEARHPRLTRLGLAPLRQSVDVRPGDTVRVDLAVPGVRSFIDQFCADTLEDDSRATGAFLGRVIHRDDGRPLGRVQVRVAWVDSTAGPDDRMASRLVRTDSAGRFTVCGIPPGSTLQALVGTGEYGQRTELFRMSEDGFLVRRLAYSVPRDTGGSVVETWGQTDVPAPSDSTVTVLPPLTVPIESEGFLPGFLHRRETREGYFLTRKEIVEADPAVLPQVFQKGSYPAVDVGHLGESLQLFDPDSPKRMWCNPTLVIDGRINRWGTPRVWHEPERVLAMEVYWFDGEIPRTLRQGPSPDLRRLDAAPPTFQGGDGRIDMSNTVFAPDCGAILIWTRLEAEPE